MRVLITSGGTKIPIDSVRSITNMSNGTFGSQIAGKFLSNSEVGDQIDFLRAKNSKEAQADYCPNQGSLNVYEFETFWDYDNQLMALMDQKPDIIVLAAAVSDYSVVKPVDGKIRTKDQLTIGLKPLPKLIAGVRKVCPRAVICGFKLLVDSTKEELIMAAENSIIDNNLDLVVANDLSTIRNDNHSLNIVDLNSNVLSSREFFRSDQNLAGVVRDYCMYHYYRRSGKSKEGLS